MSEGERRHQVESEGSGVYVKGAETVPVDLQAQERELEAAGWERLERMGKVVWRRPDSNYLYPQGAAIALLRTGRLPGTTETAQDDS